MWPTKFTGWNTDVPAQCRMRAMRVGEGGLGSIPSVGLIEQPRTTNDRSLVTCYSLKGGKETLQN